MWPKERQKEKLERRENSRCKGTETGLEGVWETRSQVRCEWDTGVGQMRLENLTAVSLGTDLGRHVKDLGLDLT